MKIKFSEFINESRAKDKYSLKEFIAHIRGAMMSDFGYTDTQAQAYIEQYDDLFRKFYKNGFDTREAIAATKRPGIKIDDDTIEETYIYLIDDDIDNLDKLVSEAKTLEDLEIVKESIEEYFDKYSSKTFSDVRIFERVKNNYKRVSELYEKKLEKYSR